MSNDELQAILREQFGQCVAETEDRIFDAIAKCFKGTERPEIAVEIIAMKLRNIELRESA